jgi:hypothetical protein
MPRYEFTKEQEQAIGQLVIDHWGGHVQSGMNGVNHTPYLSIKFSHNSPVRSYEIHPDGTVVTV